jgi:hypothetical protein
MFTPGTKVRTKGCPNTELVPGVYTVRNGDSDEAFVYLEGIDGGWFPYRFELIKEDGGFTLSEIDV